MEGGSVINREGGGRGGGGGGGGGLKYKCYEGYEGDIINSSFLRVNYESQK